MPSNVCPHCGASEIESDSTRGISVCTGCGSVLNDQIIVSEVQFEENAAGGSNIIGQFVSSEGSKGHGIEGFNTGLFKESRQVTIDKGRKLLQQLGGQLRLNQHCIDTALNFYKMCLARNMTRGRRLNQLMAACLYIVCRTEGTSHMLLDISDLVRVNVYSLGQTYMQVSSALCINIPAVDPCLFIHRFAQKMKLGEKSHDVCMTALRLVSRMKRDWMATGRRPSGLCGAALIVAARMHDINSKVKDIIRIVKLSEATIRKRLLEFGSTASGALTVDQFQTVDLEEEQDPPSYSNNRLKSKLAQLDSDKEVEQLSSEIFSLKEEIELALENSGPQKKLRGKWAAYAKASDEADQRRAISSLSPAETPAAEGAEREASASFIADEILHTALRHNESPPPGEEDAGVPCSTKEELSSIDVEPPESLLGPRPTAASLGIKQSIAESLAVLPAKEVPEDTGELNLDGIDDDDLDKYILSKSEVKVKTHIWMSEHGDFLRELEEKQLKKAEEEEERKLKGKEKRKTRRRIKHSAPAQTAGEAMKRMLEEKRISTKINYDVLRSLEDVEPPSEPVEKKDELPEGPLEATPILLTGSKRFHKPNVPLDDSTHSPLKKSRTTRKPKAPLIPQVSGALNVSESSLSLLEASKEVKADHPIEAKEPVLVESGPVAYAGEEDEEEEDFDEEEEQQHFSAAMLMGHSNADEDEEDYY